MSKKEKLLKRFLSNPKDFTWDEMVRLLTGFGYVQMGAGKTGGSRCRFDYAAKEPITLHKPHPAKIIKPYIIKQVRAQLEKEGFI